MEAECHRTQTQRCDITPLQRRAVPVHVVILAQVTLCPPHGQPFLHGLSSFSTTFMMVSIFLFYSHLLTNHKWTHLLLFYILLKSYGK